MMISIVFNKGERKDNRHRTLTGQPSESTHSDSYDRQTGIMADPRKKK